jgi:hypothetical protein
VFRELTLEIEDRSGRKWTAWFPTANHAAPFRGLARMAMIDLPSDLQSAETPRGCICPVQIIAD